jgi:hypothetical protein
MAFVQGAATETPPGWKPGGRWLHEFYRKGHQDGGASEGAGETLGIAKQQNPLPDFVFFVSLVVKILILEIRRQAGFPWRVRTSPS